MIFDAASLVIGIVLGLVLGVIILFYFMVRDIKK